MDEGGVTPTGEGTTDPQTLERVVSEALDGLRGFRGTLWPPILLGLVMLFDSWDGIAIAYVLPSISKEWGLNPAVMGALISSGYFGQFFGALVLSDISERIGRMPVFLVSVAVMGCLALASAWAPSYSVLLGIRFMQGLAIGGALPVAITYINELAPTATRGRYFSIFQFLYLNGFALASLSSTFIVPYWGWRWLLGLGGIPLLLLPFVALTLPESPRWLVQAGRGSKIPGALARLGGHVTVPDAMLADDVVRAQRPARLPLSSLFVPAYRRTTIVLVAIWFFTSFVNLGLTTWVPSIYVSVYKLPLVEALAYASAASIGFKLMVPVMAVLIDRFGRRPLPIVGTTVATALLFTLACVTFANVYVVVALVISAMLTFSISAFMIWPTTAESLPTQMRAMGLGLCSAVGRGASMLTPLFIGGVLGSGGTISIVYAALGVATTIVLLLWIFGTTETARVRLETV